MTDAKVKLEIASAILKVARTYLIGAMKDINRDFDPRKQRMEALYSANNTLPNAVESIELTKGSIDYLNHLLEVNRYEA